MAEHTIGYLIALGLVIATVAGGAAGMIILCKRRILSLLPETPRWRLRLLPLPIFLCLLANPDRVLSLAAYSEAHPERGVFLSYPENMAWNVGRFFFAALIIMALLPFAFTWNPRILGKIGLTILWTHLVWMAFPFDLLGLSTGVPFQD